MNMRAALRGTATLMLVASVVDPSVIRHQRVPLPVSVRAASADTSDREMATAVRRDLARRLGERIELDSPDQSSAVILVGDSVDPSTLPTGAAVSLVSRRGGPNVRVTSLTHPDTARVGWAVPISATLRATDMKGRRTRIALEYQSGELAVVEHVWTSDVEAFEAPLDYMPSASGILPLAVVAHPVEYELSTDDNRADFRLAVEERPFRILMLEPRPSWASTFIRRALEEESLFDVDGLARPTRGVGVRAGSPPQRLTPEALVGFDVVVAGAPEELRATELDVLSNFVALRGGAVVFVPDNRPAGPYVKRVLAGALQAHGGFQELLSETSSPLQAVPISLQASEFAIPRRIRPGVEILAALPYHSNLLPVVVAWPTGAGRMIFSGALDAWRYRDRDESFARFWRAQIASAASAAPARLEVSLDPAVARPGQNVRVRARLRPSEFSGGNSQLPVMSARLTNARGRVEPIRLWPAAEVGLFEGTAEAPEQGRYLVEVSSGTAVQPAVLIIDSAARTPSLSAPETVRHLVAATKGVVVEITDLTPLESYLASAVRPRTAVVAHPARSAWWGLACIGLLCLEWWLRRRQGLA
jgi:hypothetical protein